MRRYLLVAAVTAAAATLTGFAPAGGAPAGAAAPGLRAAPGARLWVARGKGRACMNRKLRRGLLAAAAGIALAGSGCRIRAWPEQSPQARAARSR